MNLATANKAQIRLPVQTPKRLAQSTFQGTPLIRPNLLHNSTKRVYGVSHSSATSRTLQPVTALFSSNNTTNSNSFSPLKEARSFLESIITFLTRLAVITAVTAALFIGSASPASAARSGGRMGGMAGFSSRSSFSSSLGSSSFGGGTSSFGGSSFGRSSFGGGSFGKSTFGRSSSSSLKPLSNAGRSSVVMNSFFFSPWGFGMGYGYGGGLTSILFWGVFVAIMFNVFRGVLDGTSSGSGYLDSDSGADKITVAKVQVGLLGSARQLQRDLERIAGRADTSSSDGLHYVLQETVLALMRNPEYCIYGFAKAGVERGPEAGEARFNKLSLEERGKFEKETLVNVGGRSGRASLGSSIKAAPGDNELIVVTILVAAEGRLKLPKVTSRTELKDALTTLGGLRAKDTLAVEVLWTPEEEGDYFTRDEVAFDYPLLNTL